jgi:hypothetical protein
MIEPLPETERRLHRIILEMLLSTGELPSQDVLVRAAEIDASELGLRLDALAEADYLSIGDKGQIICLYPLSPTPTPHLVAFDGVFRHAMCAIDALGMAAMLDQAVTISSSCAICHSPIQIEVSPGAITRVKPMQVVVVASRDIDRPACESCCPNTLFACSPEHGGTFAAQLPAASLLSPVEALASGETIFGGLLAPTLPAKRPRMHTI